MSSRVVAGLTLEGHELVINVGDETCRLPAGLDPLSRLPHVARAMLDAETRVAFELLMQLGLGCAGVVVRKNERNIETPIRPDAPGDPAGDGDDC